MLVNLEGKNTRMIEQLVFHTQLTIHVTNPQDLNTRPGEDTVHPPSLTHELMVIEPGGKPCRSVY